MDEKFLNKIVELQNLFDEGVVTTADNIPQPEPRQDVVDRETINRFMRDNPMADGGRINFDGGGSPLQKFKQEIVESMKPYAPGDITEDQLQLIVRDITLDMTAEQAQSSALSNFRKLFSMADGGMLVSPSADGSRPGYGGPQPGSVKNKFREWVKTADKEFLKTASIEDIIKKSKIKINDRNALNVFAEDEFKKFRPTRDFDESARTDLKKLLKNKTGRMESVKYKGKEYYKANDGRIREKISLKADRPEAYEEKRIKQQKKADLIKSKDVFPSVGKNTKLMIWRDLYDSSIKRTYGPRVGDYEVPDPRLKVANKGKINLTTDFVKNKLVLLDTKTGKKITFKNLEKYINNLPGISYKDMELPYKYKTWLSDQTINYKGRTNVSLRTILRENLLTENELENFRFSPYEVHHPFGKNENPFKVALAMRKANGAEGNIRLETLKELDKAGITEKDVDRILNNFEKKINKLGGIQSGVRDVLVGEELSPENFFKKLTSTAKIGREVRPLKKDFNNFINLVNNLAGELNPTCRKTAADGGRINFEYGSVACQAEAKKYVKESLARGVDPKATDIKSNIVKKIFRSTLNFAKGTLDPKELLNLRSQFFSAGALASIPIFDGVIAADAAIRKGKPIQEALKDTLSFSFLSSPQNVIDAQKVLDSTTASPAAKDYAQRILTANELKETQTNVSGEIAPMTQFKKIKDLEQKLKGMEYNRETGLGGDVGKLDFKSELSNIKDKFTATPKKFDAPDKTGADSFFSGELKKVFVPGEFEKGPTGLPVTKEKLVPAYTSDSYDTAKLDLPTKDFIGTLSEALGYQRPSPEQAEEMINQEKFRQLFETPGFTGTQERFNKGGIAGLSGGDKSGPPPQRGPNSEGLSSLLKRGTNI